MVFKAVTDESSVFYFIIEGFVTLPLFWYRFLLNNNKMWWFVIICTSLHVFAQIQAYIKKNIFLLKLWNHTASFYYTFMIFKELDWFSSTT